MPWSAKELFSTLRSKFFSEASRGKYESLPPGFRHTSEFLHSNGHKHNRNYNDSSGDYLIGGIGLLVLGMTLFGLYGGSSVTPLPSTTSTSPSTAPTTAPLLLYATTLVGKIFNVSIAAYPYENILDLKNKLQIPIGIVPDRLILGFDGKVFDNNLTINDIGFGNGSTLHLTIVPITGVPTSQPTAPTSPTQSPTKAPSLSPSLYPTGAPSSSPTKSPTVAITQSPTGAPSESPSAAPTLSPNTAPTTSSPSSSPTKSPTVAPSASPTKYPTAAPSASPTPAPTHHPDTIFVELIGGPGDNEGAYELSNTTLACGTNHTFSRLLGVPAEGHPWNIWDGSNYVLPSDLELGDLQSHTFDCTTCFDKQWRGRCTQHPASMYNDLTITGCHTNAPSLSPSVSPTAIPTAALYAVGAFGSISCPAGTSRICYEWGTGSCTFGAKTECQDFAAQIGVTFSNLVTYNINAPLGCNQYLSDNSLRMNHRPTAAPTTYVSPYYRTFCSGSRYPTATPTASPSASPTVYPTAAPTVSPTSSAPTEAPSASPSAEPSSSAPTEAPSASPSAAPTITTRVFTATEPCGVDTNGCATSPNWGTGNYGSNEDCILTANGGGVLIFTSFAVEACNIAVYDYLQGPYNGTSPPYGTKYCGPPGNPPPAGLEITNGQKLKWDTDGSTTASGWKVCIGTVSPTTSPTTSPSASPTASPSAPTISPTVSPTVPPTPFNGPWWSVGVTSNQGCEIYPSNPKCVQTINNDDPADYGANVYCSITALTSGLVFVTKYDGYRCTDVICNGPRPEEADACHLEQNALGCTTSSCLPTTGACRKRDVDSALDDYFEIEAASESCYDKLIVAGHDYCTFTSSTRRRAFGARRRRTSGGNANGIVHQPPAYFNMTANQVIVFDSDGSEQQRGFRLCFD